MVIVGLKPTPQTLYKVLKRKASNVSSVAIQSDALEQNIETQQKDDQYTSKPVESLAGCLAWLPVTGARGEKLATKGTFSWAYGYSVQRVDIQLLAKTKVPKLWLPSQTLCLRSRGVITCLYCKSVLKTWIKQVTDLEGVELLLSTVKANVEGNSSL